MTRLCTALTLLAAPLAAAAPAHAGSDEVEFDDSCAGGLVVGTRTVDGTRAPWLTSASRGFDAPAGTQLTKVTTWRHGEARDDREETASDDGDHWEVASYADGQHLDTVLDRDPDTCRHGAGVALCAVGSKLSTNGALTTDGWHRADAAVAWSASDNVGIRRARLLRIRRESTFPFELGTSRAVRIRVS